jgi:hypothetical protein
MKTKYTPEMVAALIEAAEKHGELNLARCHEIASLPLFADAGITPRGVIAKVRTMGLPYVKKARLSKTGQPVMRKDEIVISIENKLGVQGLESLVKADKLTLNKLLDAI